MLIIIFILTKRIAIQIVKQTVQHIWNLQIIVRIQVVIAVAEEMKN